MKNQIKKNQTKALHWPYKWWGLIYDAHAKRVLWYCVWPGPQKKYEKLGLKYEDNFQCPPMWTFTFSPNQWEPLKTAEPWPRYYPGASLEYVEDLKKSVLQYTLMNAVLDIENRKWTLHGAKKKKLKVYLWNL